MPKVSVIVPNYNHAQYLVQRIESILNQTYTDFELILLDDCSTDNSVEVLKRYANHPKVSHFIINDRNSGSTFKQWDKGINLAQGEWIWIAESDDWCELTLLETIINEIENNAVFVLGYVQSYYIVDENKIKWISNESNIKTVLSGKKFMQEKLLYGCSIFNASMAVFKKENYFKISQEYLDYKLCGDWLFWANISIQGDVFISGKILNYFRNHEGDVSTKINKQGLNYIEELRVLFSFRDNSLITEVEFFDLLKYRHLIYKFKKNIFSSEIESKIKTLFYKDNHTRKYKLKLIINYLFNLLQKSIKYLLSKILIS